MLKSFVDYSIVQVPYPAKITAHTRMMTAKPSITLRVFGSMPPH
jgi:hypothetical protein